MNRLLHFILVLCTASLAMASLGKPTDDLLEAVKHADLEGTRTAIAAGADVNAQDAFGNPVISNAVWWPDILKEMIAAGANVNNEGKASNSPLYAATVWRMTESMRMLIEAGADVNYVYNGTKTKIPLIAFGASSNCAECIQLLIDAGADVNAKDKYKMSAISYAAGAKTVQYRLDNHEYTMNYLKNVVKLTTFPPQIENPTADNFDEPEEIMMVLINAGADPNEKDKIGSTPIIWAANWNNLEMVKALIKGGADVNHKNKIDETAIQYAAAFGNLEMTKALLDAGADPNVEFEDIDKASDIPLCEGFTPLAKAVQNNHYEVAKLLVEHGADVDADLEGMVFFAGQCRIEVDGKTPLFFAVEHNNLEMVKLLVEHGAKVNAKQKTDTPKDFKVTKGPYSTITTWCEGPNRANTPIEVAKAFGYTEIVSYLEAR